MCKVARMESTYYSSKILENADTIATFYKIVKQAGLEATKLTTVKTNKRKCSIIKPNQIGMNRLSKCIETTKFYVKYNSNDLMIVGSSALNLYDFVLQGLRHKYKIKELEAYIKNKAVDIDIVWWPRPSTKKYVITSDSIAVREIVKAFKMTLVKNFNNEENISKMRDCIRQSLPSISNDTVIRITLGETDEYREHLKVAGIWTIQLNLEISCFPIIKLCDIVIHDSGASQKFGSDGSIINTVYLAEQDPLYCSPYLGFDNSIAYLNINGAYVAVPNLLSFTKQQMFAFDNFIREKNTKCFTYYKRAAFIKTLVNKFDLSKPSSKHSFERTFGSDDAKLIKFLCDSIYIRIINSISKYNAEILDLCRVYNTNNDNLIQDLCEEATLEPYRNGLYEFKLVEIAKFEKYKQDLRLRAEASVPKEYHHRYIDLQKRIHRIQANLDYMSLKELISYQKNDSISTFKMLNKEVSTLNSSIKKKLEGKNKEAKAECCGVLLPTMVNTPSIYVLPTNLEKAPLYPPPIIDAPYYIEESTGKQMRYDSQGFWYYIPPLIPHLVTLPYRVNGLSSSQSLFYSMSELYPI